MKKVKVSFSTVILIIIFFVGLSLLLYPTVSNYWNSMHQTRAVAQYNEQVANLNDEEYTTLLQRAQAYNQALAQKPLHYTLSDAERAEYESVLDVSGTGIMGYIEIPSIDCTLPIYHGVDDSVLQIAAGHLEWSSLPIGGANSHSVLSGHRGLPSAKLFTHLDKLKEGDTFMIRVLDETLTYEVDQINILLPDQLDTLRIEEGKDLCTLVTCTPYGINTHRLLVRGTRIANQEGPDIRVPADAVQIDPILIASLLWVPLLIALLPLLLFSTRRKR